jgi:hypothetical protein
LKIVRVGKIESRQQSSRASLLLCFLGILFDPEDRGSISLLNFGIFIADYVASHLTEMSTRNLKKKRKKETWGKRAAGA